MSPRLSLIGGYLGSGKTTLVNRLISGALPGRTAVVVNDFGSVNIDADLIIASDGDTIELSNGCICCQISDDVSRTMTALAARDDLDNVICEVSGVGDPGGLAAWRSYPGFLSGSVVVCADATSIARRSRDQYVGDTVARQFGSAEIVLVTKTDIATPGELASALEVCGAAAPHALLIPQDPEDPHLTAARAFASATRPRAAAVTREHAEKHTAAHTEVHQTTTLEFYRLLDVGTLCGVLSNHAQQLVRAKGFVRGLDSRWHSVQLAGGRIEVAERAENDPVPGCSRLVLIAAGAGAAAALEAASTDLASVRQTAQQGL